MSVVRRAILLLVAELFASWWVWSRALTDTLREAFPSFWVYESTRLVCWTVLFLALFSTWLLMGNSARVRNRTSLSAIVGIALALALEVSTSLWYWRTWSADAIRDLYGSVWYWHDGLPQGPDLLRLSLWAYVSDHALPWVVALAALEVLSNSVSKGLRAIPRQE